MVSVSLHYFAVILAVVVVVAAIFQDTLGQDIFLLGSPGPYRRHLALAFCELTGREVEYVSLSRDTTETDLKQRREIINSTVHYIDQVCIYIHMCVCSCVCVIMCM